MSRPMFSHSEATAQRATRHDDVHGVSRTAEHALSLCERLSIAAPTGGSGPSRNFGCGSCRKAFSEGV
jgi:hypothetical protein